MTTGTAAPQDGSSPRAPATLAAPGRQVRLSIHADLAAVEQDWRAFQARADGTVFQTYEWLSTWQRHVGAPSGARPVVVVGRDAHGAMLFLLPLMIESSGPFRRLTWLGSDLCDYNAPLLAPDLPQTGGAEPFPPLWREILARLRADGLRFDLVVLPKMPETVGGQPNPFMQLARTANPSGAYLTHLAGDWESHYAAKRSASTQRRDRARRKKLSEFGALRLAMPTEPDEILRTLDTLVAQKSRAFARMGVPNIFERPGWLDFYRALATDPASRGIVQMSRLDVGAAWAAVSLGVVHRGRYYYVLTSYDGGSELAKHSPGMMHLLEQMRHAIEGGCTVFDFTIGDEAYKREWSDTTLTLYDHVSAASWRGAIASAPIRAASSTKRWIKRNPTAWNAVIRARAFAGSVRGR